MQRVVKMLNMKVMKIMM